MSLENAPDEVKLAVDLIVLLEENQVAPETVLKALEIVKRDYEKKQLSSSKKRAIAEMPDNVALTRPTNESKLAGLMSFSINLPKASDHHL